MSKNLEENQTNKMDNYYHLWKFVSVIDNGFRSGGQTNMCLWISLSYALRQFGVHVSPMFLKEIARGLAFDDESDEMASGQDALKVLDKYDCSLWVHEYRSYRNKPMWFKVSGQIGKGQNEIHIGRAGSSSENGHFVNAILERKGLNPVLNIKKDMGKFADSAEEKEPMKSALGGGKGKKKETTKDRKKAKKASKAKRGKLARAKKNAAKKKPTKRRLVRMTTSMSAEEPTIEKPVVKKPVTKKPVAKKAVTKKPVVKKPVVKKPVVKKSAAKKIIAKKSVAKKSVAMKAKKLPVKKPVAKKLSTGRSRLMSSAVALKKPVIKKPGSAVDKRFLAWRSIIGRTAVKKTKKGKKSAKPSSKVVDGIKIVAKRKTRKEAYQEIQKIAKRDDIKLSVNWKTKGADRDFWIAELKRIKLLSLFKFVSKLATKNNVKLSKTLYSGADREFLMSELARVKKINNKRIQAEKKLAQKAEQKKLKEIEAKEREEKEEKEEREEKEFDMDELEKTIVIDVRPFDKVNDFLAMRVFSNAKTMEGLYLSIKKVIKRYNDIPYVVLWLDNKLNPEKPRRTTVNSEYVDNFEDFRDRITNIMAGDVEGSAQADSEDFTLFYDRFDAMFIDPLTAFGKGVGQEFLCEIENLKASGKKTCVKDSMKFFGYDIPAEIKTIEALVEYIHEKKLNVTIYTNKILLNKKFTEIYLRDKPEFYDLVLPKTDEEKKEHKEGMLIKKTKEELAKAKRKEIREKRKYNKDFARKQTLRVQLKDLTAKAKRVDASKSIVNKKLLPKLEKTRKELNKDIKRKYKLYKSLLPSKKKTQAELQREAEQLEDELEYEVERQIPHCPEIDYSEFQKTSHGLLKGIEFFDKDKLKYILNNKKCVDDLKANWKDPNALNNPVIVAQKMLDKSVRNTNTISMIKTHYHRNNTNDRLFAKGSASLQACPRRIRHAVSGSLYRDIDLVNGHPTLVSEVCKTLDIKSPLLDFYVNNRKAILKELKEKYDMEKDDVKPYFIALINGSKGKANGWACLNKTTIGGIENFGLKYKQEIKDITAKFVKMYPKHYASVKKYREDKHKKWANVNGSFMSSVMTNWENLFLETTIEFFQKEGFVHITDEGYCDMIPMHDGLQILRKHGEITDKVLRDCEAYLKLKLKLNLKILIKPMDEGFKTPYDKKERELDIDFESTKEYRDIIQSIEDCEGKLDKNRRPKPTHVKLAKLKPDDYDFYTTNKESLDLMERGLDTERAGALIYSRDFNHIAPFKCDVVDKHIEWMDKGSTDVQTRDMKECINLKHRDDLYISSKKEIYVLTSQRKAKKVLSYKQITEYMRKGYYRTKTPDLYGVKKREKVDPVKKSRCEHRYLYIDYETVVNWNSKEVMIPYSLSVLDVNREELIILEKLDTEYNKKLARMTTPDTTAEEIEILRAFSQESDEYITLREKAKTYVGYNCTEQMMDYIDLNHESERQYTIVTYNGSHFDNMLFLSDLLNNPKYNDKVSDIFYTNNMLRNFKIYGRHELFDLNRHCSGSLRNNCKAYKIKLFEKKAIDFYEMQQLYDCGKLEGMLDKAHNKTWRTDLESKAQLIEDEEKQIMDNLVEYNDFDTLSLAVLYRRYETSIVPVIEESVNESSTKHSNMNLPENYNIDLRDFKTIGSLAYKALERYWENMGYELPKFYQDKPKNFKSFDEDFKKKWFEKDKRLYKYYTDMQKYKTAGRVEVFNGKQKYTGRSRSLDVTSSYPYSMAINKEYYPSGNIIECASYEERKDWQLGWFYCTLNQKVLRDKGLPNLVAEKQPMQNVWKTTKVLEDYFIPVAMIDKMEEYGMEIGEDIIIKNGICFSGKIKGCELFKPLLKWMTVKVEQDKLKGSSNSDYNPALRATAKLLLNCISGKIIERLHVNKIEEVRDAMHFYTIKTTKGITKMNTINILGNKIFCSYTVEEKSVLFKHRPVYLGCLVYCYSQINLYDNTMACAYRSISPTITDTDTSTDDIVYPINYVDEANNVPRRKIYWSEEKKNSYIPRKGEVVDPLTQYDLEPIEEEEEPKRKYWELYVDDTDDENEDMEFEDPNDPLELKAIRRQKRYRKNLFLCDTDATKMNSVCAKTCLKYLKKKDVPHWPEVEAYDSRYKDHKMYSDTSKVFGGFEDEFNCYNNISYWLAKKHYASFFNPNMPHEKPTIENGSTKDQIEEYHELMKRDANGQLIDGSTRKLDFHFKGVSAHALVLDDHLIDNMKFINKRPKTYGISSMRDAYTYYNNKVISQATKISGVRAIDYFDKLVKGDKLNILCQSFRKQMTNLKRDVGIKDVGKMNSKFNTISQCYSVKSIKV